jgi:hypothetical protein
LVLGIDISNFDIFLLLVIPQKVIPNVYVLSAAMFNGIICATRDLVVTPL